MNRLIYMVDQNNNNLDCSPFATYFCDKYGLEEGKVLRSAYGVDDTPILVGASLVRFKMIER